MKAVCHSTLMIKMKTTLLNHHNDVAPLAIGVLLLEEGAEEGPLAVEVTAEAAEEVAHPVEDREVNAKSGRLLARTTPTNKKSSLMPVMLSTYLIT